MKIPALEGTIDRRILINYKVEPRVLRNFLPPPFKPIVIDGYGIAGVCLLRLKDIRVKGMPRLVGLSSENAAHRISVYWEENGLRKTGVYLPRIDTSSFTNVIAGGRIFPGIHHLARFSARERNGKYRVSFRSVDGTSLTIKAKEIPYFPAESMLQYIERASAFFQNGTIAYSPRYKQQIFDGLELKSLDWEVRPLLVSEVISSFFENTQYFPKGSIFFDHALLAQNIRHEWHKQPELLAPRPVRIEVNGLRHV